MSTIPGESTWADAGLLPPNGTRTPLVDATDPADSDVPPQAPRPDLRDEASEPDVVDQALDATGDDEDYRGA